MTGSSAISPQATYAAERQPTNFEGLKSEVVQIDDIFVTRSLICGCGSDTGRLFGGKFSEGMWGDPLTWVCTGCRTAHNFFDSARDGYDGRFGHGSCYEQAQETAEICCPSCGGKILRVRCGLAYNNDPSDFEEDLGENLHLISDYFDGLDVNAECTYCQRGFNVGTWELA
jgi:DNA-directed RNA polymerase subunit RPC12/RpoP